MSACFLIISISSRFYCKSVFNKAVRAWVTIDRLSAFQVLPQIELKYLSNCNFGCFMVPKICGGKFFSFACFSVLVIASATWCNFKL